LPFYADVSLRKCFATINLFFKYDLNAVEPREITASKTASYDPKPRNGETERLDWIDAEQPRDTKLFRDYEGKPFKVHCKHCLKI
jgi:hypothetical protein